MDVKLNSNPLLLSTYNNISISNSGDIVVSYKVQYPERYNLKENDFHEIALLWHRTLKELPLNTVFQKADLFLKEEYQRKDSTEFLSSETEQFLNKRIRMKHTGYLFFILPRSKSLSTLNVYNPFKTLSPSVHSIDDDRVDRFIMSVKQAVEVLNSSCYFQVDALSKNEVNAYYHFYFGGFSFDASYSSSISETSVFESNGRHIGAFSINSEDRMPEEILPYIEDKGIGEDSDYKFYKNNLDCLGTELNVEHLYLQTIYLDRPEAFLSLLEKKQSAFFALRGFGERNGFIANKLSDEIRRYQEDTSSHVVRGNNTLLFWCPKEEFQNTAQIIKTKFVEVGVTPVYAVGEELKNLYFNNHPLTASHLNTESLYYADLRISIAYFINQGHFTNDGEGIRLYDRLANFPITYDFWDRGKKYVQSRNFMIVAPTGSGKSVTAQHLLSELISDGVVCVIVDLGRSYYKFSKLLNKEDVTYVEYKEGEPLGINPLAYQGELTNTHIENVGEFIWTLIKRDEIATEEEKTSLRKILGHYFAMTEIEEEIPSWHSFYEYVNRNGSVLKHSLGIPDEYFNFEQFTHNGSDFSEGGMYGFLFDKAKDREDFDGKKLILFELSSVMDNPMLLNIMLLAIQTAISKAIWNDQSKRGVLLFDEFGQQLKFTSVLNKVAYIAQAIRKQNGAVGIILQTLAQMPENQDAKSIISNTATRIILQSPSYAEEIRRLSLDSHKTALIKSLRNNFNGKQKYAELAILRGKKSNVYRIELAPAVFYAYQTDGDIHSRMLHEVETGKEMSEVIKELVRKDER